MTVDERRSHKKLSPEIKALKALVRAVGPLSASERHRALEWLVANQAQLPRVALPHFPERTDDAS